MIRWIIGSLITIRQYKTERCFTWHFLIFNSWHSLFSWGGFYIIRVKKRIKFFDVHLISTLSIYFFKSLLHKSSHTISWMYCNRYHIYNISPFLVRHNVFGLLRHNAHEDTSVYNNKCFAYYNYSYIICVSLIYLYL